MLSTLMIWMNEGFFSPFHVAPSRHYPVSQFVYSAAAVHFAVGGMGGGRRKGSGSLAVGIQFVSSWDVGVADDISFVLKWAGGWSVG